MLPSEAAEEDRHFAALVGGECPLYRSMKVLRLVKSGNLAQPGALCFQALLDFVFFFDLNKIRRHYLPPA